jgi:hypothetical protein
MGQVRRQVREAHKQAYHRGLIEKPLVTSYDLNQHIEKGFCKYCFMVFE